MPLAGIGVGVRIVDGVGPVIDGPDPVAADVDALRPFDAAEAAGHLWTRSGCSGASWRVPLIGFAGAPFTLACYLVEGRGAGRHPPQAVHGAQSPTASTR